MLNRMAAGRALRALDNFEDTFYELAMPRPLQPEVQILCQKQDEDARILQIADSVANHVAASLEMALSRAMMPLTQSLDTFIKCATREQVDGVRRIVGQFVQQLNMTLGDQMTQLGATITAVSDDQRETQRNLHNTMAAAQSMSKDAEQIRMATSEIAAQIKALSHELQENALHRKASISSAVNAGDQLTEQIEKLSDSLQGMQLAIDLLTAELNEVEEANESDEIM